MALSDFADRIVVGVKRIAQRDLTAARVAQLARVESNLDQLMPVVEEAVSLVDAASTSGLTISAGELRSLRVRISEAVQGDVDAPALEQLIVEVRTEAQSVKTAATASWHELVDRTIPQRQGLIGLADTYRQLDPGDAVAKQLRQAIGEAQQLASTAPSTEALRRLDHLATQIPQLLRDLVGDNASVRSFAERVARGGASLDSVTPEVKGWITSKGFEGSFKIVPGEPVL